AKASLLLAKLCSNNLPVVLHAIAATERMALRWPAVANDAVAGQLLALVDHRNDEVRAKSLCALARLEKLDETTIESAAMMLESNLKHLLFAGVYALSKLDSVPGDIIPQLDRCLVRVLRSCDYEFLELFVKGYRRWLDDPQSHFESLLQNSPEYLPIVLETLQKTPDDLVQIRLGA
ncbi:MAG: hypothetical protein AAFX85_08075, partial [Pseudomonadota bacterium]